MHLKTIVVGTGLSLAVSAVAWWSISSWTGWGQPVSPASAPGESWELARRHAASDTLAPAIERLRRSLQALEERVSQLSARRPPSPPAGAGHSSLPRAGNLADRVQQLAEEVQALAERQQSIELAATDRAPEGPTAPAEHAPPATAMDVALAYDTTLQDEAIEAEWEQHRQDHFAHFFHSDDLVGARLQTVECRTTLCRLEVALDNQDALTQLVSRVTELLEPGAQGILFTEDEDPLYVKVYLSRSGYPLPAQSQRLSP